MALKDNTFEILKVFYDEMIKTGSTHKCVMKDIDNDFLDRLYSISKNRVSIEYAKQVVDLCIANEWLKHAAIGNQYGCLRLTTSGLGVVKSKIRQFEEISDRTLIKKLSDYIDDHKGVFVLLSFTVSFFSLLVAVSALYISFSKGN